jgi:UDP-N-acetylglucosamine 2-epimerase (non-hydrolysing)
MSKIMTIFGTRPEAIKMAPVIKELKKRKANLITVSTGQHSPEMLNSALGVFGIKPDYDLDTLSAMHGQSLSMLGTRLLNRLEDVIATEKPDYILVQGDTSSAFFGALAGFYSKIPVGHIEAGLRTYCQDPYPEEAHRRMIAPLATHHFAPTAESRDNLIREGISEASIFVTGNTGIDAFLSVARRPELELPFAKPKDDLVLITAHRRENFKYMEQICDEILDLVNSTWCYVVFPVHPNPNVKETAYRKLSGHPRIMLTPPLDYLDLAKVMMECKLVITDSGGIQEEAPSLGKPVLVIRESTERTEGVKAGVARLCHPAAFSIVAQKLLTNQSCYDKMANAVNPYGDGHAAEKIVSFVLKYLEDGDYYGPPPTAVWQ